MGIPGLDFDAYSKFFAGARHFRIFGGGRKFNFFAGVKVNDPRQWRCGMAMVCNGSGQSWQSMGNPGSSGGNTIEASE